MSKFNLMHCQPDPRMFTQWAARRGWLGPGGNIGYAMHVALHEAFGERAPRPFYYRDARAGLLAYAQCRADELREAASLANPDLAAALGLDCGPRSPGLNVRSFPMQWSAGRALGFEVRVRPVRRDRDGREHDALHFAIERKQNDDRLNREEVYRQWLEREFTASGAAKLVATRMTRFHLTGVLRRTQADGKSGAMRRAETVFGLDAVFSGQLTVDDPDAFALLLKRGVGRHRSFGFGMLLLRPAVG
ncbi:CRISPR-associated protein, Cse3 family [Candidatus Burkholderia verschuerenii]|uniref:CRISPR-associated protein, Cse3 family n=1 Tax=Candidatus Burkholderia verschuerenii TaxID=242163 RepID=A0A0L0MAR8_9BURK|nr:type I-E CRISPR-associated protein Cas6/Cse3/CasE [Candidatus Burkholderia verschuerenii]KND59375.1 CRISPR-associated protein, Cse3 family [Candidatus Burkholderia verschuerenii]